MIRKILSSMGIIVLMLLLTGVLTAAAPGPAPTTTFTLVSGLPATMNVGESYTVVVNVTSDQQFLFAAALPSEFYPGRGVVAAQGDHARSGTTATLEVTFTAKGSTAGFAGGVAPVSVTAGAHYPGGSVASQRFDFYVVVP